MSAISSGLGNVNFPTGTRPTRNRGGNRSSETETGTTGRTDIGRMVQQVSSQILDQAIHSSPFSSGERQFSQDTIDRMSQMDPKLAQNYQALLDFIAQQDPDAAKSLAKTLDDILGTISNASGSPFSSASFAQPSNGSSQVSVSQFQFAMEATVTQLRADLADGTTITAERVEIVFSAQMQTATQVSDPLMLDLDGNGFDTTDATGGHSFDLLGSGKRVQAATASGNDVLLVYDRNQNGTIDDGTELFGDQNGAVDGFAELAKYDQNQDGKIDAEDEIFTSLAVFQDSNRNGLTDHGELRGLADISLASIQLNATKVNEDSNGNRVDSVSSFTRTDGTQGRVGELFFRYLT